MNEVTNDAATKHDGAITTNFMLLIDYSSYYYSVIRAFPSLLEDQRATVTIHFYNTEKGEPHTFTIGAPYNIDKNVPAEQNATIIFKANHEGIFQYYCRYHLPTMQGQLIVTR